MSENMLTIETNKFAFEIKVILGIESTRLDGYRAKIELNCPND